eukprot:TRINITY_DN3776_c0_g1_i1.p1 TRINITY_DN3776_c0_g1~~TRINITY_DN3776_c0_g1_i1.p1  ORF type:complete len:335 (-),score=95.74 TRINITY_DN3776_c0_g1_i1:27-1031(-)
MEQLTQKIMITSKHGIRHYSAVCVCIRPIDVNASVDSIASNSLKSGGKVTHLRYYMFLVVCAWVTHVVFQSIATMHVQVRVWDCRTDEVVASFSGHRDAVTALAFRHGSYSLYSGSADRSIKHWGLSEMAYVETLFGHQGEVNALDAFRRERAVSGARDGTVRAWKILEETHLVFRPGAGGSVDAVACIDDEWFVSGGEDGALSLWFNLKKKPVAVAAAAHGVGRNGVAPWVCAAAAARSSDLAVTGSSDGYIRLWHCDTDARTLEQVNAIPLAGFVNGLSVASTGRFAVAAVGQDHRLGRWERQKDARNRVCIVPLTAPEGGVNGGGGDDDDE